MAEMFLTLHVLSFMLCMLFYLINSHLLNTYCVLGNTHIKMQRETMFSRSSNSDRNNSDLEM